MRARGGARGARLRRLSSPSRSSLVSWIVARRFKRFYDFHQQLTKAFGKAALPQLPPKQLRRNLSQDYIESKRKALDAYLQALAAIPAVRGSELFASFLAPPLGSTLTSKGYFERTCELQKLFHELQLDAERARSVCKDAERQREIVVAQLAVETRLVEESRAALAAAKAQAEEEQARLAATIKQRDQEVSRHTHSLLVRTRARRAFLFSACYFPH